MSSLASQASQRQKVRDALERLGDVEEGFQTLTAQVNNVVSVLQNQVSGLTEIVDAVIRNAGVDTITALVVSERERKAKLRSEEAEQQVAKLVEQGVLVKADAVGEDSFIVGYEADKAGTPVNVTGRVQLQYSQIADEFKTKLGGTSVGFKLETETGTFEVKEIYNIVAAAATAATEAASASGTGSTDTTVTAE